MKILVAYKVLSDNEIKDNSISVSVAFAMAKDLLSENQSDFALANVEAMLTALENLQGRIYLPGSATFSEPDDKKAEPVAAPKPEPKRCWLNTDLKLSYAILFRKWLVDNNFKYETSGNGELTHFEVFLSEEEREAANKELDRIRSIVSIF